MLYARVVTCVVLCMPGCLAQAQDHPARVRDLVVRLGLADEARHALDTRIYALRDARPEVYGEFWVEFMSTVRTGKLLDALTAHFVGVLSETDVDRLLAFTADPNGLETLRAWTRALPGAVTLRAAWEQEVAEKLKAELERNGYPPTGFP